MIEFDTCMATAERINPTILPSSHAPPSFYHHHHHHHHHHSLTGGHHHNNGGGGHSQVISDGQNGQIISHPRLNSLLTKSSAEQLSSPPLPPPPPSLPPLHHTSNPVHHTMNGHNHSNSSHHSGHHHNHNHNHNQQQHSTTTAKKVDRSSAACNSSSSVQQGQHHNQSAGKKHSQIVSKLQQSISSRLKQTGAAAAAAVAHQQHSESTAPLVHHSTNSGATRPRTHSLPPPPPHSQPGNVGDMSAILSAPPHPPPPALMATKSNVLKISTTSNNSHGKQSQAAAVPPSAVSPNSLEDAKKKKKSHLSRDELSRVCQCGDVTFEAYNGSTYMIAIRSMGDRKSLIGYRCDWNACGYMNARVERMFGHIRSQHPEAPTVKKLVTTTGATMTTSTVTTTTSSGQDAAASAAVATTTTTNSTNMTTMSTTSSSSGCNSSGGTVSARLSLRSSSSLSTASSASSCSLSPRSSQKSGGNAAAANSSAHQSTLMSVLNGTGDVPVVKVVNNKRAHNKAHSAQGSKCSSVTNTATGGSSSALDALENITASMASQHEHVALPETSSQSMTVDASTASAAANASALKHTEEVDSEEKLMDLLNLSGDDISAQVKGEGGEQEMTMVKKEEEAVEEKMNLNCTTDSVTNSGLENSIATVNSDQLQQHIKVELNSPIDEMIAEANLDGDKLAALDPAELAETTEQIMQELKTISSNCEQQQQSSVPSENILTDSLVGPNSHNNNNNNSAPEFAQHHNSPLNNNSSFPSPVDSNNNHHLGNGTAASVSVNVQSAILEPQSSVMTNMCNGNETLMEQSSTTTGMQSLEQENNKIVDTLDLFDADIEQLLLNEQPEHHNDDQKLPNYPGDTFNLDGPKYAANSGEQQVMSANGQQQQPMQQHSSNGTFVQCQGQPQVTPPPALLQQHNQQLPPMAPMINTTSTNGPLHVEHPIQQTPDYDDYHNLSEFSFDSINGVTGDGSMMDSMNGHELGEKLLHRGQSVGSEHMHMYGDDAEAGGECFDDMESGMHDDGSNGSGGSSSAGSGKGSRTGKKTGSSKNYIGKQNLFQEFQSEDVAKVRDSENQYIIALQKNMKIVGYRCDWPECEFLTCRKYVMVNHINGKHTNQRPYSCPLCNFNFVKRYFLKAHMHKVHKRRISIDGKDDDDDMPPSMRGDKRDHELMMDSFDDNQFEGIPDTPETPNTGVAVAASSAIVPPVVQSNKKSKSQQKSEPPAYPASAMSNGSSSGYYSNSASMTDAYCPPMVANGPGGEFGGVVGSGEIPATVQQYSNYNSGGTGYGPHHQHHSSVVDPMLSGRGQMNGYYSDDAYGSNLPVQSGNAMACNTTAAASYKSNGGQMNSGNATGHHHQQQHHQHQHQQSAVFMTPSPSSSVASPLSFPTATGSAGTPNQKCSFPSQVSMYDNFGDSSTMQYNTAGNGYAQQQPQQPPFIGRSYSQSSQSSGSMYGNAVSGKSPLSSGMMNTADLLTPPLSSGGTPTQGNCCRSGSIGGSSSAGRMSATPNTTGAACYPQDNFNSNSFSSEGMVSGHTYQNSGSFDDFLSPPSSISSSNSNFSGYMNSGGNMCGVDQQQQQQQQQQHQSSATTQRGQQASTPASASMANASSFYLHTPSPSPSSLSHSPASAPVYGNTAAAVSSSYNNNMSSSSQTPSNNHQYQTNFSNAFPNSADLTGNNNNSSSGNSAAMVNQSPSHSSYQAQPSHQSKSTFPQSHASFASQQQQQSMRPVQSQTVSYNNNSQSMQYGNAYDGSGYFDQHNTESAYPAASGRSAAAKSVGPSAASAVSANSASANSHFYGNHFAPMNPTSGLFDSYADSYPVGGGTMASGAAPKQQMYPGGGHHQQMPSAAAQAQTTFNGAQYW